jgi:hypothetical protein
MPTGIMFTERKQRGGPSTLNRRKTELPVMIAAEDINTSLLGLHNGVGLSADNGLDVDRVLGVTGSAVERIIRVLS